MEGGEISKLGVKKGLAPKHDWYVLFLHHVTRQKDSA